MTTSNSVQDSIEKTLSPFEKLCRLQSEVKVHCNYAHSTLVHYVLGHDKSVKGVAEFDRLRQLNEDFANSFNSLVKKYISHLEGKSVSVTSDELNAFTKAFNLQKMESKKAIETLTMMGADRKAIDRVEAEIAIDRQFLVDFIQEARSWT